MGYFYTSYNMFTSYGLVNTPLPYVPTSIATKTPISYSSVPVPMVSSTSQAVSCAAASTASNYSLPNVYAVASKIADRIVSSITSSISSKGSSIVSKISHSVKRLASSISNFGRNMVDKARSFLGYNERNGSYKLFTQGRTEAWCADFVSYVARQCGMSGFNFSSVSGILNWGKQNGRFSTTPKVGDAIIFKGAGSSHTGIVSRIANGRVYTIEGNTSDRVAERSYAISDSRITGYVTIG